MSAHRRVSFSERISYSDDTTTECTEDELYKDDGSFASNDDGEEDESLGNEEDEAEESDDEEESTEQEKVLANVARMCKDSGIEIKELDDSLEPKERRARDEDESEDGVISRSSYLSVADEPPLVFRDVGITQRPSDYLGGYEQDASCDVHRVKLRKSWVASNPDEEDQSERHEFEAWKRERAKAAAAKKKAKSDKERKEKDFLHPTEKTDLKPEASEPQEDVAPKEEKSRVVSNEGGIKAKTLGKEAHEEFEAEPTGTSSAMTTKSTPAPKKKKNVVSTEERAFGEKKTKTSKVEEPSINDQEVEEHVKETFTPLKPLVDTKERSIGETTKTKARKVKKPTIRDPELEAHEKEVLELKERIASLQRQLDVAEVRTISQLADLEEETTKRMREYRAKADEIVRKQRAKNEKKALKEKAMKSQDLIDQLRKSNQKMRAEGTKMQAAIAKLREANQSLEEKNSVHRGHASEFLSFQKIEVSIAEAMNQALSKDIPKYEKLIRSMEEGVLDRLKSGHVERNAKELYEDCIHTMVDMLDANCSDATLLDRVALLMEDEEEEDRSTLLDSSSSHGVTRRSLALNPESKPSSLKAALVKSTMKRPSRSGSLKEDATKSTEKAVRRSKSVTAKISKEVQQSVADDKRSGMGGSLRGTRTNRKASLKPVSDSDDSSTCSVTSMPSATSEVFSISDYVY